MAEIVETLKVKNKLGLHARPAALLVKEASKYEAQIELENENLKANGKSIMGVLMLAAEFESEITIFAKGVDAEAAVEGIRAFFDRKFDEEDEEVEEVEE